MNYISNTTKPRLQACWQDESSETTPNVNASPNECAQECETSKIELGMHWLRIGALYADEDYTHDMHAEIAKCRRAATRLNLTWERAISQTRTQELCDFRFMACKHLREKGFAYREIAQALKRADHSTCIYQYKQANALIDTDRDFRRRWVIFKQS